MFQEWWLPAAFDTLRKELESTHATHTGSRQFVRVLQLLGEHPLERVQRAIESSQACGRASVELVIQRTEQQRQREPPAATVDVTSERWALHDLRQVHVPRPDLKRFDAFLSTGCVCDGEIPRSGLALEDESQAVAVAEYAGRV